VRQGVRAGVLVALLDMLKGALSVLVAERLSPSAAAPAVAGLAAIVGHIYPVWLRFRGGKGVATACGVFSILTPLAVPPALAVFVAAVWITKYISLGSVLASIVPAAARLRSRRTGACSRRGRCRCNHHRLPAPLERCTVARRHRAPPRSAGVTAEARTPRSIAVLGAGSWGTALAVHLSRAGHDVHLWARDPALVSEMRARRANAVYLPDVTLPMDVTVTDAIADAVAGRALVVAAIPSHGCRAVVRSAVPHLSPTP
jgi:acyl-phosphate glycerol 3-phosphate acyltransferase